MKSNKIDSDIISLSLYAALKAVRYYVQDQMQGRKELEVLNCVDAAIEMYDRQIELKRCAIHGDGLLDMENDAECDICEKNEIARLKNENLSLFDNLSHIGCFYRELVALVLHGDHRAEVNLGPGGKDGSRAEEQVRKWRSAVKDKNTVRCSTSVTSLSCGHGAEHATTETSCDLCQHTVSVRPSDAPVCGHLLPGRGASDEGGSCQVRSCKEHRPDYDQEIAKLRRLVSDFFAARTKEDPLFSPVICQRCPSFATQHVQPMGRNGLSVCDDCATQIKSGDDGYVVRLTPREYESAPAIRALLAATQKRGDGT